MKQVMTELAANLPPAHQILFATVLATCILVVVWPALPWNSQTRRGPWS